MREKFNKETYKNINLNDLIIFSIYLSVGKNKKCSFEEIIEKSFFLFPEKFSFNSLPKWPDSRKLDRPLRYLRRKKLIIGDPKNYFSLTKQGEKIAKEIAKIFRQKKLNI